MTLKAGFTINDIKSFISAKLENYNEALLNAYQYAGEQFVRAARLKTAAEGGFNDITGNLRSSIGYIIMKDGKQMFQNFQEAESGTDRETGKLTGQTFAEEIAATYPKGLVLVCVAGMDYAAAVEAKSKDVITGSTLELQTLLKRLLQQL